MRPADVAQRFAARATVNTPLRGAQTVNDWVDDEQAWLAAGSTQVRAVNYIVTDTHASVE